MAKLLIRKWRVAVSRIFVILVVFFAAISQSAWEDRCPIVSTILFLTGIFLVGTASLGRLWCSLFIAGRKTKTLITTGPYSVSRNPLYFFGLIGALGVGLTTETMSVPVILLLAFTLYYPFVISHEEEKLRMRHGQEYEKYVHTVPRFFPRMSRLNEPQEYLVDPIVFRKHYSARFGSSGWLGL
jgi:protein-S-isoprenylcysteine O-methyltransferase Ste14